MISHQYRCIFIHQRKTAGYSIISNFGFTDRQPEWHAFNEGTLSKEWLTKDKVAPGYRIFTVIRNPWDRFNSGWKYLKAYRDRPLADVLRDLPKSGHDFRHLTRPQLDILTDATSRFVPDYVLRFEHLAEDYARFCELIDKPERTLPRLNSTKHGHYSKYYDATTIEMVRDRFRKDVEFFGYDYLGAEVKQANLAGKLLLA